METASNPNFDVHSKLSAQVHKHQAENVMKDGIVWFDEVQISLGLKLKWNSFLLHVVLAAHSFLFVRYFSSTIQKLCNKASVKYTHFFMQTFRDLFYVP